MTGDYGHMLVDLIININFVVDFQKGLSYNFLLQQTKLPWCCSTSYQMVKVGKILIVCP